MSGIPQPLPKHLEELLFTMDFIGALPKSHKMCIKDHYYVHKDSYTGAAWRWIAGESQIHTCTLIKDTVDSFAYAIVTYHTQRKIYDILMTKGLKFRQGIVNLIGTYSDVPEAVSHLRTALDVLDLKLPDDVKRLHGILQPSGVVGSLTDETLPGLEDVTPRQDDYSPVRTS